jgi:hypothetical protein
VTLNSQRLKAPGFLQPARWAVSPLWEQVSRPWAATAFVFVWVAFLWLLGGVPASDVVLFTVYEVTFVALPGWVVYGLLRPESSKGERLVFGWALGYALVIAAFAVTAAAGVRFLLFAYPLLVGAFGLWRVNTTGRVRPRPGYGRPLELDCGRHRGNGKRHGRGGTLPTEPLPGTVHRVTYFLDNVFQISLAAEALHHWPLTDPTVNGQPLHTTPSRTCSWPPRRRSRGSGCRQSCSGFCR